MVIIVLLMAQLTAASATPSPADTVVLSPAEREAALVEGEARAAHREAPVNGAPLAIHGEMGVEVGTHGGRAAWGTAAVPLGSSGQATFSVAQQRYGERPR